MPKSPVFIVGSPRSGTSVLVDAMVGIGYAGFREGNFLPLITTLNRMIDRHFEIFGGQGPQVLASLVDRELLKRNIAELFRKATDDLNPAPLWFDKSGNPEMIYAIPTLRLLWPDCVFIFAKRRAIENIVSRQKKFPKNNFEYHCTDWAKNMSAWREMRQTLPEGDFIEIDQQDLVQHPEAIAEKIRALFRFGDEVTPKLLKIFAENRPQQTDERSAVTVHALETVPWTAEQKEIFLAKCGDEMKAYGYSLGNDYWATAAVGASLTHPTLSGTCDKSFAIEKEVGLAAKFLKTGEERYNSALGVLSGEAPVFLSRIGGSDTNAVVSYLLEKDWPEDLRQPGLTKHQFKVKRSNGYYDKSASQAMYIRYIETLYDCYKQSDQLIFCNYQLLSLYFPESLSPSFYSEDFEYKQGFQHLVDDILKAKPGITCYPYSFIERLIIDEWTMFQLFSTILRDKKVLVICPFAESIALNFPKRHGFFKRDFKYPEFDLKLYNTPITYSGLPDAFYPDDDWFQTLERIKAGIKDIDFDIALLACGSYALPVGTFIADELHRKAVYVGGILQLFFGVMGRRWANAFQDQINSEAFIYPVERETFLKYFTIDDKTGRDAFGAYF